MQCVCKGKSLQSPNKSVRCSGAESSGSSKPFHVGTGY